jgi:cell division protein ZapA
MSGTISAQAGLDGDRVKTTTRVEIYDQTYQIAADSGDEYVRLLAERLDARMRQIARQTRVVDSLRVAVLAAMNLADENQQLREKCSRMEEQLGEKCSTYHAMLDRALGRAG